MLGFSLSKLILLVLVIGAVWYGFKIIGRLEQRRRQEVAKRDAGPRDTPPRTLTACPSCGAYYDPSTGPVCPQCRR